MKSIKWLLVAIYFLLLSLGLISLDDAAFQWAGVVFLPVSVLAFFEGLMGKNE